jgi:uncharacterized protein DUF4252
MKKILVCTSGFASMVLIASLLAQDNKSAGFVDFGKLPASASGKEFVEISLGRAVFAISGKLFEKSDPDVAGLLRGLQLLQVNVVGLADDNREKIQEHVRKLRTELTGKGWERIVTVREKNDDVAVFLKTRGEEAVEGLVVTVLDGNKEAVLINIVGNIKPEQVAQLGEKMGIDPLKKFPGAKKKEKEEKAEKP